jgi:4-amino-4-deoxy-L-arabinose transferase-like glycosyltransferase
MNSGSQPATRSRFYLVTLMLFWAAVYVPPLFRPALLDDADSVHAEAAREMLVRRDWVTLYIDGIRYLEKAPLMYWSVALSFRLFGIAEWTARLPLALGVLALVYSIYFLGRRPFGESGGFYAALAAGFSFGPFVFTRFLIPDILVGLWLILSLDFFLRTLDEQVPSRLSCWGLAVGAALNVLTKGLIGLVFPAATILLYLLLTGNLRHLLKMRLVSSGLVFLAVAAPWHILASLQNPDQGGVRGFLWFYFVNEHFLRYLNKRVPRDYGTVPLPLFWGLLLVWLLPWSSFLPQAIARVRLWRARTEAATLAGRARLLFLLSALLIMVFFSFSTRQEYYAVPALAPLALLIGGWLGEEQSAGAGSPLRRSARVSSAVLFALGSLAFVFAIFLIAVSKPAPPGTDIATLIQTGPAESQQYALSLGHFLDLNTRAMALFRAPLLLFTAALFLGGMLNWLFRRRRESNRGNWVLAIMSALLLLAVHQGFVTFSPVLTSKPLADAILRVHQPGDVIVIHGQYEEGSTLNFYTGKQVRIWNGRESDLWYGSFFPDAPQIFDDNESFRRLWAGPKRVFVWMEEGDEAEVLAGIDPAAVYVFARSGGKLILTNRPIG